MNSIYVGDSKNVFTRINNKHSTGNVKVSAFRASVAKRMGVPVISEPTNSRNGRRYQKVYINLPNRRDAERQVSGYIAKGRWKFVACVSKEEARDFQYYAIDKINPELNRDRPSWNKEKEGRYAVLLSELLECEWHLRNSPLIHNGPGVYLHGNPEII